jgi:hypothetical protein
MLYFPVALVLFAILVPIAWMIGFFIPVPCEYCGQDHPTSKHEHLNVIREWE